MAVEAAELFVTVTADTDKAIRGLSQVNDHANKSSGFLKGAAQNALGFATGLGALAAGGAVFGALKGGVIDMNASLETSTLQFTTLMGDSDKARAHVEDLFDFAAKTPFETGPIIEASRIMETFGGSALDTNKNLKLFGDAAAATSAPINEVAFWMSRAYTSIQAGKPWGEAAQRLGELGIVTPKTRAALEKMQAEGAKGPEVWGALTGSLGKFGGAMESQAGTFDGMMSTMSDNINMFLAKAGKPLFDGFKSILSAGIDLMNSPAFNGAVEAAGRFLGDAFGFIGDMVGKVLDVVGPIVDLFSGAAGILTGAADDAKGFGKAIGDVAGQFADFGTKVQDALFGAIESVLAQVPQFTDAFFKMASQAIDAFVEAAPGIIDALLKMTGQAIDWLLTTGVPMLANALSIFGQQFIEWVGPAAEKLAGMLPVIGGKIIDFIAQYAPVVLGKLVEWGGAFLGWIATNVLPKLPGALAHIGGVLIGWIAQTAPVVVGRIGDMAGKMLGALGDKLKELPGIAGKFLGEVVTNVIRWGGQMVAQGLSAAIRFVQSLISQIIQAPGKIMGFLGQLPGMLLGWGAKIATGALDAARKFVMAFINGLASLPGRIADAVRSAFRSINIDIGPFHINASGVRIDLPNIQLPSFATGAWNLPRDMVAQVHAGEMIVPRDIAERLRGGGGFGGGGSAGGGGGDVYQNNIYINEFYGTEENVRDLSRALGEVVRYGTLRKSSAG